MAKTARTYRNQGRNPRYTTKMQTMANGMYLTKQVIPEGYAKCMVNYDIDDTGSYIRPRKGRELLQTIGYPNGQLGPATLADYIYAYRHDEEEIEGAEDLVLSSGLYIDPNEYFNLVNPIDVAPVYLANMLHIVDPNVYDDDGNTTGTDATITTTVDEFWAIRYNNQNENFEKVANEDIGVIQARTINNAYAFDKKFLRAVGRPIRTMRENVLYAFTGAPVTYREFPANTELNTVENLGALEFTELRLVNTGSGYKLKRSPVQPYDVRPSQAMNAGFNLLSPQPYKFEDELGGSLFAEAGLPYKDRSDSIPDIFPSLGESREYRIYYQYPEANAVIQYKVEAYDSYGISTLINDFDDNHTFRAGEALWISHIFNNAGGYLTVTLRDKTKGASTDTSCTIRNGYGLNKGNEAMLELKEFDLSTCTGMVTWYGSIGIYGVESAKNTIFFSSATNPGYFPYPGNYMSFDNEILAVHNYLDHLLVITVDSVYIVTIGDSIVNSVKRKLLDNVHIPEIDAINVAMFKDEIFFKTDTEFYVLKPNKYTADATDLKNYSNSTALINYTTNFTKETVNILNEVYKPIWQQFTRERRKQIRFEDFDVLDTRSVAKDAEIHYIYTIIPKLTDNIVLDKLNLHIIYNTLTRSWRMYTVAIGNETVQYNPVYYRNKKSGAYEEFFAHTTAGGSVVEVVKQTRAVVTDNFVSGDFNLTNWYNNYPYLDTGNIDIDDSFTKRFREVQFNLVNKEKEFIRFYTDFKLDGMERVSATHYEINHITDVEDPDYGLIYVTPIEYTNLDLIGLTTLSNEEECDKIKLDNSTSDLWNLDLSKFPDLDVVTVRFELQGRGRRGSIQLLNTSLEKYELANLTWAYRIMNAR